PLQAQLQRRLHVAADRLAIHSDQPLDRPEPRTVKPDPEHLSNLEHAHLPEGHSSLSDQQTDGDECTGPQTGAGGPRAVQLLARRWSHHWPNRRSHDWPRDGPMPLAKP